MDADQPGMEPEADARSRKLSKKRKNALTRPETVPSQGPKRPLGVREPPRQPNRPGNPPNPEPEPGALACCLGRNQREGFPSRQFWVKPDRLLDAFRLPGAIARDIRLRVSHWSGGAMGRCSHRICTRRIPSPAGAANGCQDFPPDGGRGFHNESPLAVPLVVVTDSDRCLGSTACRVERVPLPALSRSGGRADCADLESAISCT